ncbi:MAG: magnesium-translocating P-type ATPase [Proteobacteria bacterium]|nr:magnesium-translocating P-type ATPase [Pseudomonadota bacterium]
MQDSLISLTNLSHQEIFQRLKSSENGLSGFDVGQRVKVFGYNELSKARKHSIVIESLKRSVNPLVAILLISAFISGLTGNAISASIIILMVILSVVIDYVQSHRSFLAIERLKEKVASTVTTMRDNKWEDILARQLVPGDIIHLSAGDLIPADSILLTAKDLHVQQAALTGESLPVEKESNPNKEVANLFEAINAVFSGSSVVSGTGTAIVASTGLNTELGKIAKSLNLRPPRTEFEEGIVRFGLFIAKTILFLVLFVFVASIYFKRDLLESLLFAVALAVGLTPEFLPMITTVTLATAAVKMARKKVIVKNLASMQNFGSIDILCSDKTGTITSGEMNLTKCVDIQGNSSEKTLLFSYLNSLLQSGIKNPMHEAVLQHVNINPLDIAILRHEHPDVQPYHKVDELPFDFERRRSTVVVDKNGSHILITKGAPETILKLCINFELDGQIQPLDHAVYNQFENLYKSFSAQGYRVLGVAYRQVTPQAAYHISDEYDLTLLGFLVFSDPPLTDAAEVISELKKEGVSVKILTGDNELVAQTICQQVGINPERILLGNDLDQMSDQELMIKADETMIFARVMPEQKQRIITVLRRHGHIVGYIGDGINDAPSLHIADVGISVAGAVDVAKESASIILLEHNLKVLLDGILEGRKAFGNIMKYLMMGTSSNFGNMFSMAGAILFLPFLPMLPMQILLNNLLYDIAQLTIPTDHVDETFIRKPRHWDIDIIRRFMLYIGPISSIFDFLTFYVMLSFFKASESLFQTGWFVESLATQTLVIFIIRTAASPLKSRPSWPLFLSVSAVVAIGIFLPFAPIASLLGFVKLPFYFFVFLVISVILYLFLVQIVKKKLMWKWFE